MEKYLTEHDLSGLKALSKILGKNLVFVDLETTGLIHDYQFAIIEVGLIAISPDSVKEACSLIDPRVRIPPNITELTGITNEMVRGQHTFDKYVKYFQKVAQNSILMGFNSKSFDSKGLEKMGRKFGEDYKFLNQIDVRYLFLRHRNEQRGFKSQSGSLTESSVYHNVKLNGTAHRAGYDIALTALVAEQIIKKAGIHYLHEDVKKIHCLETKSRFVNFLKENKKSF